MSKGLYMTRAQREQMEQDGAYLRLCEERMYQAVRRGDKSDERFWAERFWLVLQCIGDHREEIERINEITW